jgi:hypothetical protein
MHLWVQVPSTKLTKSESSKERQEAQNKSINFFKPQTSQDTKNGTSSNTKQTNVSLIVTYTIIFMIISKETGKTMMIWACGYSVGDKE